MHMTSERFYEGMVYEAFKAHMTRNREQIEENERTVRLSEADIEAFQHLEERLFVMVLAEDWCSDVVAYLPVLARLAEESGKLEIRIFLRDNNPDLAEAYLKQGQYRAIPVFAFFNASFEPVGHWIERPVIISGLMEQMRREQFSAGGPLEEYSPETPIANLPEEARLLLTEAYRAFRLEHRTLSDREVVRELRQIVIEHHPLESDPEHLEPVQSIRLLSGVPKPVKVSITYCADCGYQPQALALTTALVETFNHELSAIELIPWYDGSFDVIVNDELIHSMYRDGGFPASDQIIEAIKQRSGTAVQA